MAFVAVDWVQKGGKTIWLTAKGASGEWNKRKELEMLLEKNPSIKLMVLFLRAKEDLCPFRREWEEKNKKKAGSAIEFCAVAKPKCPYKKENDGRLEGFIDEKKVPKGYCPYYFLRHALKHADIVICDYNYVIHPIIRNVIWKTYPDFIDKKTLLLFDEVHLLPVRARGTFRTTLSTRTIDNAIKEVECKFLLKHPNRKSLLTQYRMKVTQYSNALEQLAYTKMKIESLFARKKLQMEQEKKQSGDEKAPFRLYDLVDKKVQDAIVPLQRLGRIIERFKFKNKIGVTSWVSRVAESLRRFATLSERRWVFLHIGKLKKKKKNYPYIALTLLDPYIAVAKALKRMGRGIFYSGTLYPRHFLKMFRLKTCTVLKDYSKSFPTETRMDIFTGFNGQKGRITRDWLRKKANAESLAKVIQEWFEITKGTRSYVVATFSQAKTLSPYLKTLGLKIETIPLKVSKAKRKKVLEKKIAQVNSCVLMSPYSWSSTSLDLKNVKSILILGIPIAKLTLENRAIIEYYRQTFSKQVDNYMAAWMMIAIIPAIQNVIQARERARIFTPKDKIVTVWLDERYTNQAYISKVKSIARLENVVVANSHLEAFGKLSQTFNI